MNRRTIRFCAARCSASTAVIAVWLCTSALLMTHDIARSEELLSPAPFIRDGSLNQDPAIGSLAGRLLRLKRGWLLVSDLERSVAFYADLIGLELYAISPNFDRRRDPLAEPMFGYAPDARRRVATFNTSDEIRAFGLTELADMDWQVQQQPRTSTVLFQTDHLLEILSRVAAAGFAVIGPIAGMVPADVGVPAVRYLEAGVVDPDGHVIALFQAFAEGPEWQRVLEAYR